MPEPVATYVNIVKQFNSTEQLIDYPGSPLIAKQFLRANDRLLLHELHSTEIQLLKAVVKDKRIKVFHNDGLKHSLGLLPPKEHRGLVLIDPSYEVKSDYQSVVESLIQMVKRFAIGTYALWYPVVDRKRNKQLEQAIKNSGIKNILLFELGINADTEEHGMTASGMIVVNPPWTLAEEMKQTLVWLVDKLGNEGLSHYRVEILASE